MENILLTEADYKDKYPPLGLMKISTYHKFRGDNVVYSRELSNKARNYFSKIYITTRFSFHWGKTKELINFYKRNFDAEILIGGIHASINPDLYKKEFGINPNIGSLKGDLTPILAKIRNDEFLSLYIDDIMRYGIDVLPPDYSLFAGKEYSFDKILNDNYLIRATKGCKRNCSFCDVKKICEGYISKLPISPIIKYIDKNFGEKNNILFFDDNTLMSSDFDSIIYELKEIGFAKGKRSNGKTRTVDFNQGLDLRLLQENQLDLINSINISPVRFAFDDILMKDIYISQIKKVIEIGVKNISVYVLYNYKDTPEDFYERLKISIDLNGLNDCRIFSFPMKYVPNETLDRKFIGKHWTKRMIRGIQCILNCSHGIVPTKNTFFKKAFGENFNEFKKIIHMPENYIIYRRLNADNIKKWENEYKNLSESEKDIAFDSISAGKNKINYHPSGNANILSFLDHYKNEAI